MRDATPRGGRRASRWAGRTVGPRAIRWSTIARVFRDDVDRLFAELFPGGRHAASGEARAPVDVYVTDGDRRPR